MPNDKAKAKDVIATLKAIQHYRPKHHEGLYVYINDRDNLVTVENYYTPYTETVKIHGEFPPRDLTYFFMHLSTVLQGSNLNSLSVQQDYRLDEKRPNIHIDSLLLGITKLQHGSVTFLELEGFPLNNAEVWTKLCAALDGSINELHFWDVGFSDKDGFGATGLANAVADLKVGTLDLGLNSEELDSFGLDGVRKILTSLEKAQNVEKLYFQPWDYLNRREIAPPTAHEFATQIVPVLKRFKKVFLLDAWMSKLGVDGLCEIFSAFADTDSAESKITELTFVDSRIDRNFKDDGLARLFASLENTPIRTFCISDYGIAGSDALLKLGSAALAKGIAALANTDVNILKLRIRYMADFKLEELEQIFAGFKDSGVNTVGIELEKFIKKPEMLATALMKLDGSPVTTILLMPDYFYMISLDTLEAKRFAANLQETLQRNGLDIKVELEKGGPFARQQPSLFTRAKEAANTIFLAAYHSCCSSNQKVYKPGATVAIPTVQHAKDAVKRPLSLRSSH